MLNKLHQEAQLQLENLEVMQVPSHNRTAANSMRQARRLRRQRRENAGLYRSGHGWTVGLW